MSEKKVMERKASDNKYLHRDFHCTLNIGIDYLGRRYGTDAVKEYIVRFVHSYYKPMDLDGLEKYFKDIFEAEESSDLLKLTRTESSLKVDIEECPAIKFMRSIGDEPSQWYGLTTTLLYAELAKVCGLQFTLYSYEPQTGRAGFEFKEAGK